MGEPQLPSFDLVVATVGRTDELGRLFGSLDGQTHRRYRVLLVDQNGDDRLAPLVGPGVLRLRSAPGLSRARNVALPHVDADIVGFPDDDCVYPDGVLERVARRFLAEPRLDGVTGRDDSPARWAKDAAVLTRDNLWNRAISFTIFLRSGVVARVGEFDERLGLPGSSSEEIDYLVRAVDAGARIEYDPTLVIPHRPRQRPLVELGARDGVSIGYILRKHRYPPQQVARMLVRPAGGAMLALVRLDRARARFHLATLRGRAVGYSRDAAAA